MKEKAKKITLISMVVSLIGVVVIFNPVQMTAGITGSRDIIGIMFALAAAIVWSLFTVISKMRIHMYGGYVFNFFAFSFGVIFILIILLVTGRPIVHGITPKAIYILLYMGIFIKAIGYIFYLGAIRLTSAVTASMVFLIKPALATILSIILLGEKIEFNIILGIAFIVVGSCISFSANKTSEKKVEEVKAET